MTFLCVTRPEKTTTSHLCRLNLFGYKLKNYKKSVESSKTIKITLQKRQRLNSALKIQLTNL